MNKEKNNKLLELVQDRVAKAIAENLVSDDETRTAIMATAVQNVLNLDDKKIRETLDYATRMAIQKAVSDVAVEHVQTEKVKARIRLTIDGMIDATTASIGLAVPKILEHVFKNNSRY